MIPWETDALHELIEAIPIAGHLSEVVCIVFMGGIELIKSASGGKVNYGRHGTLKYIKLSIKIQTGMSRLISF